MIKIAICDDNTAYLDKIRTLLSSYGKHHNLTFKISCFSLSNLLLESCSKQKYDIAFLDVEMIPYNGIDVGAKLRELFPNIILVYISGYIDYSLQGYKVKAFRYILKQDLNNLFDEEMDAVMKEYSAFDDCFSYKKDGETINVPYKDIRYVMSESRKIIIHMSNNIQHEFYSTLDSIEKAFEQKHFLRVQQSYLINIKYAIRIKDYKIYLDNGEIINTSRNNFKLLKEKYTIIKGRL